jgi:hypothetical protein
MREMPSAPRKAMKTRSVRNSDTPAGCHSPIRSRCAMQHGVQPSAKLDADKHPAVAQTQIDSAWNDRNAE